MAHVNDVSGEDLERLLSGMTPAGSGLEDLTALVRDVRFAYLADAGRAVEDRHVLAIVAAGHPAIDTSIQAMRPAGRTHGSARQASGFPTWGRRTVLSTLFASVGMKVAGTALAATAAAGGLAATGNLPDAAQTAVAEAVEHVGIHIPNPGGQSADHRQDAGHRQDDNKPEDGNNPEGANKPEDAGDKSVSADVKEAVDGIYETGRDKGAAVSDAADQNRQDGDHPQGPPTDTPAADPSTEGNRTGFGPDNHPTGKP